MARKKQAERDLDRVLRQDEQGARAQRRRRDAAQRVGAAACQSISRHHEVILAKFDIRATIAMIGTASRGPKTMTSTGSRMTVAPVPTMPLTVPATKPTARTRA